MENQEHSSAPLDVLVEQNHEQPASDLRSHGGLDPEPAFSKEEVRGALEVSASTGRFWIDWEKLNSILSYHLKQVLAEYPEAKMTSEQQTSSLGETFQELVKRLDDALHSFDEGPPLLCRGFILLSARSIYPKLSKLCLALQKNLLVTSTLKVSCDQYSLTTEQDLNGCYEGNNAVENGALDLEDRDVVMTNAQEAEVGEDTIMEMETVYDDDIIVNPKVDL